MQLSHLITLLQDLRPSTFVLLERSNSDPRKLCVFLPACSLKSLRDTSAKCVPDLVFHTQPGFGCCTVSELLTLITGERFMLLWKTALSTDTPLTVGIELLKD